MLLIEGRSIHSKLDQRKFLFLYNMNKYIYIIYAVLSHTEAVYEGLVVPSVELGANGCHCPPLQEEH